MLSCQPISGGMKPDYYAKDGYYTHTMSAHDRWEGTLAKAMELEGKVTQEQFEALHDKLVENGREKRVAMDCAFSAPKSVSLAMAESPETRAVMQKLHEESISLSLKYIQENYVKTRIKKDGKMYKVKTGNCCAAEFEHYTNRNNDLDLHTHVVIANMTVHDGKTYTIDFGDIMRDQNEVGLVYRQYLAQALQREGYELEITDKKYGFFELKGFNRETIMEHSTRRQEILESMGKSGGKSAADAQNAAMKTRQKKKTSDLEKNYEEINQELFKSGKLKIIKNIKEENQNEHERDTKHSSERGRAEDIRAIAAEPGFGNFGGGEGQGLKTLAERCSLPDLSDRGLDEAEKTTNLLLPSSAISRLAILQTDRERDAFMQRKDVFARRERIDNVTEETIKEISREKFAFTIPEIRQRIMSAGVLEGITRQEAERAMERAELIKLGHIEHGNEKSRDVYLATKHNIDQEYDIIDRMKAGRDKIESLTQEQSKAAFNRLKTEKALRGEALTPNAEQTNAIHHVMTCGDRFLAIQGLAGTGKTYTMTAIRELCEQEGITVRGACFTGKAADGLQNESGIESGTIHSFLNQLEAGKFNEKSTAVQAAEMVGEIAKETLLPQGWQKDLKKPEPIERTGLDAVKQAAKELAAEALPNAYRKAAQAELRKADNEIRYEQRKAQMKGQGIKQEWNFVNVEKAKGREIWIVDEAGLVDNNLMEQLLKAAEARGAQVVLSGDYNQLPPVGAGEPMKAMVEEGMATAYLENIQRQEAIKLLEAVRESVTGNTSKTFKILEERGDYTEIADKKERHEAIKTEVVQTKLKDYILVEKNGKRKLEQLLLVSTNADRKAYNKEIRAEYVRRGELEEGHEYKITSRNGDRETTEKRHFAVGDRMIFTANDNKLDVKNGTLGTIEKIENNRFTVRTDAGELKQFYIDKYNDIDHSYAVTNYKAQGMTVQKVLADMSTKSRTQDRNALYVDISRAKLIAKIYTDNKQKLEKQVLEFCHKITSKDFVEKIQKMERGGYVSNNDRYHAPEPQTTEKIIEKMEKDPPTVQKKVEQMRENMKEQEEQQNIKTQPKHEPHHERDTGMGFSR